MGCLACGRGFHAECERGCSKCHVTIQEATKSISIGSGKGAPIKDPDTIQDRLSTGRKRAAKLYPIYKAQPCEWRGKKNCGGGTPIVGCLKGFQQDRHHGPVKDPLRNEPGNVHRICKFCHNRWHVVNDPLYDAEAYDETVHDPQPATEDELILNEMQWRINK